MIWIFLAVVLVLAVSSARFRKFLLGGGAVILVGLAITVIALIVQDRDKRQVDAAAAAKVSECIRSHTDQSKPLDKSQPFDPDAYLVATSMC